MSNITKQDIEKCVKDVLQQKHIPSEERLRIIIAEEIEKYHKREELKETEGLERKLSHYKIKNIFWYILMCAYLALGILVIRMCSIYTEIFFQNWGNIELYHVLLLIVAFAIVCFIAVGFVKLYDILIKRDNKGAKIIIGILIIYWLNIIWTEAIPWVERLF